MRAQVIILRTEEGEDHQSLTTYASVIDLVGNLLMEETRVKGHRKYEGMALFAPGALEMCPGVRAKSPGSGFCSCFMRAQDQGQESAARAEGAHELGTE